jgi:hypothetical protein
VNAIATVAMTSAVTKTTLATARKPATETGTETATEMGGATSLPGTLTAKADADRIAATSPEASDADPRAPTATMFEKSASLGLQKQA